MMPGTGIQIRIPFCFPHACYPESPTPGIILLALLHVVQTVVRIVTGVLTDPDVLISKCNVCNATQVLFPWPAWIHQLASGTYPGRCLSSQARTFVQVYLQFYCWLIVLQIIDVKKGYECWHIVGSITYKQYIGAYSAVVLCGPLQIVYLYPVYARVPWATFHALIIGGWICTVGWGHGPAPTQIV